MKRIFCLMALVLSSCGPIYHTEFAFRPPKSASGRTCIFQCETVKQQCRQIQEMKNDTCENRSQWENARCEDRIRATKGREPKWYECGGSSCSVDYDMCDESYRSCYQSCGGEVVPQTVCVSGCNGAQQR